MDSEEIVYNPLARLVEHEYYDNLDEDGKVAYIFNLASKYSKLRKRYFEEKKTSVKWWEKLAVLQ